jgi:hypothetical protein
VQRIAAVIGFSMPRYCGRAAGDPEVCLRELGQQAGAGVQAESVEVVAGAGDRAITVVGGNHLDAIGGKQCGENAGTGSDVEGNCRVRQLLSRDEVDVLGSGRCEDAVVRVDSRVHGWDGDAGTAELVSAWWLR